MMSEGMTLPVTVRVTACFRLGGAGIVLFVVRGD